MSEEDDRLCRITYTSPESVMFLDIEASGFKHNDYVTCIGWAFRRKYHYWLPGLETTEFMKAFHQAKLLVTFNGRSSDLKHLDRMFCTRTFSAKDNLDLMILCKRWGLRGGQKDIEKATGFERHHALNGLNGRFAVERWEAFINGDNNSARLLIAYNFYDVLGLTYILDWFIHESLGKCGHFYSGIKSEQREAAIPSSTVCEKVRAYIMGKRRKKQRTGTRSRKRAVRKG